MPSAGLAYPAPGARAPKKPTAAQVEAVERLVREQVGHVQALAPQALRAVAPVLRQAIEEARAGLLKSLSGVDGNARFDAYQRRQVLASLEAAFAEMQRLEPAMAKGLALVRHDTGPLAVAGLTTEIARFGAIFGDELSPPQINIAAVIAQGDRLLVPRHRNSAARYAGGVLSDIKHQLAVGVASRETFAQMTNRLRRLGGPRGLVALRGKLGDPGAVTEQIAEGLFTRYHHWAERLVRTELMHSYNSQHDLALEEMNAERAPDEEPFLRRWDASADKRVCRICHDLDSRVAPIDGLFLGRWKHPPAHPHCRCILVAWHARWGSIKGEVPIKGDLPTTVVPPKKVTPVPAPSAPAPAPAPPTKHLPANKAPPKPPPPPDPAIAAAAKAKAAAQAAKLAADQAAAAAKAEAQKAAEYQAKLDAAKVKYQAKIAAKAAALEKEKAAKAAEQKKIDDAFAAAQKKAAEKMAAQKAAEAALAKQIAENQAKAKALMAADKAAQDAKAAKMAGPKKAPASAEAKPAISDAAAKKVANIPQGSKLVTLPPPPPNPHSTADRARYKADAIMSIPGSRNAWESKSAYEAPYALNPEVVRGMTLSEREFAGVRKSFADSLPRDEKDACLYYSHQGDRILNSSHRYNLLGTEPDVKAINDNLIRAIGRYKMPKDTYVARGMSGKWANQVGDLLKPGDVFREPGFTSTSATKPFEGNVELRIKLPKGTAAAPIPTRYPSEYEFLLPPGTKFRVVSNTKTTDADGDAKYQIEVEVIE